MKLRFHPAVQSDINEVPDCYAERSETVADRFWKEFHDRLASIEQDPGRSGFLDLGRGLRRARLRDFPHLIIFYQFDNTVKVTCVKHEKRHPLRGLRRR
ncbi:MAG: type II toxin-antitoxin system RelE/ParE family toxin [Akkermansiaceae bacterium]|nr:type II toxin-antitoxin system RelE/ParE family toxin [Akkermansiaceae bacterium]MCF7730919.1 type II toxin-antitoxin system RelE/ParE family toxin [Akkermansiaceae bacterium]